MNKKIIMNRWGMIVSRLFIIICLLVNLVSCKKEVLEDDYLLLNLIIEENNYKPKDSIRLYSLASNKRTIRFFQNREIKEEVFYFYNNDSLTIKEKDSTYFNNDSIIKTPYHIKRNEYIIRGKGVTKEVELFLKDSFDYEISTQKWDSKKISSVIFETINNKIENSVVVSKPVYNKNKDKAIIFTREHSVLGYSKEYIFLLLKENNHWKFVYKEERFL